MEIRPILEAGVPVLPPRDPPLSVRMRRQILAPIKWESENSVERRAPPLFSAVSPSIPFPRKSLLPWGRREGEREGGREGGREGSYEEVEGKRRKMLLSPSTAFEVRRRRRRRRLTRREIEGRGTGRGIQKNIIKSHSLTSGNKRI